MLIHEFPDVRSQQTPARLSACIIACNEADRIADCIRSVAFCDEVLVVDCGSVDGTVEIARRCGAKVLYHPWTGIPVAEAIRGQPGGAPPRV